MQITCKYVLTICVRKLIQVFLDRRLGNVFGILILTNNWITIKIGYDRQRNTRLTLLSCKLCKPDVGEKTRAWVRFLYHNSVWVHLKQKVSVEIWDMGKTKILRTSQLFSNRRTAHCGSLMFDGHSGTPNRSLVAFQTNVTLLDMRVSRKTLLVLERLMMSLGVRCEKT